MPKNLYSNSDLMAKMGKVSPELKNRILSGRLLYQVLESLIKIAF
tara:strand:+ start:332 stop:466 length:135 start_codon:yes stop_codon:yes gene_type:complete